MNSLHQQLPSATRDGEKLAQALMQELGECLDWTQVRASATPWVQKARVSSRSAWTLEGLLQAYPLSSPAGRALMHLAECLLRIPDDPSALAMMADQLTHLNTQVTSSRAPLLHRWFSLALAWSGQVAQHGLDPHDAIRSWRGRAVLGVARQGIGHLSSQFVLGQTMLEALSQRGALASASHPKASQVRFSFDMLGEGARSEAQAQAYLTSTLAALEALGGQPDHAQNRQLDGLSVKLSGLYAYYDDLHQADVMRVLWPRMILIVDRAAASHLPLTIDAEESTRLELMLDLMQALAAHVRSHQPNWQGLGLAIQAYQTRALEMVDAVIATAKQHGVKLMVRLVKGAYWDSEIKRAQELGLSHYPVYTQKSQTELSYLACARRLLAQTDWVYPQFATHNAATIAALGQLIAQQQVPAQGYEWQRLHGMGQPLYRAALSEGSAPLRIYAPVGRTQELLAYLIRRLLENAANTSFVHQLAAPELDLQTLLRSPFLPDTTSPLPAPNAWLSNSRPLAQGDDLIERHARQDLQAAIACRRAPPEPMDTPGLSTPAQAGVTMNLLHEAWRSWRLSSLSERRSILLRAADALEQNRWSWVADLMLQAHKTAQDAIAEVREAIDYLRYYAQQSSHLEPLDLDGPTGERNRLSCVPRGVFVCISPWNFPLAIFTGQVAAALICGNAVAAKPAEQTPGIALRMVELLYQTGLPTEVLQLVHGPGASVGAALVSHPRCAGVAFTGSTATARRIALALAQRDGPLVPLIAETGGLNAMIVDSTGLPEQIVDHIVASAFLSAGQRCSALRLLCVHEDIAEAVLPLLAGAMQLLRVGDPLTFSTDLGPLIDTPAWQRVSAQVAALGPSTQVLAQSPLAPEAPANCFAPTALLIRDLTHTREEIFGPVLQILRWGPKTNGWDLGDVIAHVNELGYGLTLGIQSRIEQRHIEITRLALVGNIYVNRAMTGAVVGVHPFGGMQASGTGPKAGGPHYLQAFCTEQTVSINTASIGGNLDLLQG